MTRDDVIRMAKEANIYVGGLGSLQNANLETIERFAEIVSKAEREACAKVCDWYYNKHAMTQTQCAAAIRARGQKAGA